VTRLVPESAREALAELRSACGPHGPQGLVDTVEAALLALETDNRRLRRSGVADAVDRAPGVPLAPEPSPLDSTVPPARSVAERVVAAAVAEWTLDVREPPGPNVERIDRYIRGEQGLWWGTAALNDRDSMIYRRNGQFAWCGAFAAFCFGAAGLSAEVRRKSFASTYRLHRWSEGSDRRVSVKSLRRGDVVVVGPADGSGKAWGNHVTIAETVDEDGVHTLEGNARGNGVNGERYEGVIRSFRPFRGNEKRGRDYVVMFGVRPLAVDFS